MTPGILTITFSPCIDKSLSVPELVSEKKLRCSILKTEPGGGGINVARVITRLGGKVMALYPSGGCTGKLLDRLMADERIPVCSIEAQNETRENIIVLESSTNKQFRFTMPGPELTENELQTIVECVENTSDIGFIVISGSLPAHIPPGLFSRMACLATRKNAKIIADTSGDALKQVVEEGVYLIKPNISELAFLAGREHLPADQIIPEAKKIILQTKCENIVVSLGAAGAIGVTRDRSFMIHAPSVNVKSTVGAGDSMVAGIVFALSKGEGIQAAVEYGVACGTAATLHAGTELCHDNEVQALLNQVRKPAVHA